MGSESSTWLPTDMDAASTVTRLIAFVLVFVLGMLAARSFWGALSGGGPGRAARRALGHREPAPWATGEWACGACHTVNRAANRACERCRAPREATEMSFAATPTEPDIIPPTITAGAGSTIALEHNPGAHTEGFNGHWRLRVNSVIVGSAAHRDGALALLRAVEGAPAVLYDPNGAGIAPYPIGALIAAFESPKLPLSEPCPDRAR